MSWWRRFFDTADGEVDTPAILLCLAFLAETAMALYAVFWLAQSVAAIIGAYSAGVAATVAAFVGAGAFKARQAPQPPQPPQS